MTRYTGYDGVYTPERIAEAGRARSQVQRAIARGDLTRQPCEECVANGFESYGTIHAHHEDYSRPLDVRWLCAFHHSNLHAAERHARFVAWQESQESA